MSPVKARAFQLCERIGVSHPDYLPHDMTPRHLAEWTAYDRDYGARDEWMLGRISALLVNLHRTQHQAPSRPEQFMFSFDPPAPDAEELDQKLRAQLGI